VLNVLQVLRLGIFGPAQTGLVLAQPSGSCCTTTKFITPTVSVSGPCKQRFSSLFFLNAGCLKLVSQLRVPSLELVKLGLQRACIHCWYESYVRSETVFCSHVIIFHGIFFSNYLQYGSSCSLNRQAVWAKQVQRFRCQLQARSLCLHQRHYLYALGLHREALEYTTVRLSELDSAEKLSG